MGLFGKYVIELHFDDGQKGFFMEIMEGCIAITDHLDAACRFLTAAGARGRYEEICSLPELLTGARIVDAYVSKARTL